MKNWYESKLVWVGLITAVFGLAQLLGFKLELTTGLTETVLGVLVVILRLITNKEITLK